MISRGIDDRPIPKDHLDIELFWMPNERIQGPAVAVGTSGWAEGETQEDSAPDTIDRLPLLLCYQDIRHLSLLGGEWMGLVPKRWFFDNNIDR